MDISESLNESSLSPQQPQPQSPAAGGDRYRGADGRPGGNFSGCCNCGNRNPNWFLATNDGAVTEADDNNAVFYCNSCGARCEHLSAFCIDAARSANCSHNAVPCGAAGAGSTRARRGTYRRVSHISERLAQALCKEPIIVRRDMDIIVRSFDENQGLQQATTWKNIATRTGRRSSVRVTRENIAATLRELDKQKRVFTLSGRRWTNTYLEKWRSIMAELTGQDASGLEYEHAMAAGALMDKFSETWERWNSPNIPLDQRKFPERQHFPPFNAVFVAIFNYFKIPYDPAEWPMPSSDHSVNNTNRFLSALFAEHKLMYFPFVVEQTASGRRVFAKPK